MYHINCGKESGRNTDAATAEYPDNVLFWRPGENGRYCAIDTDFFIFIGGSTMRNKKGFTLVELVIVIAVIAILAGVMIGTFASVVKKAKDSAKAQEMAAAKQEQTAKDVIEKLNNSNWLGWEDFEEKLATRLTTAFKSELKDGANVPVDAIQDAVKGAVAAYYANAQLENTGLTEQQVKTIINDAFAKVSFTGVSAEQVKAIVNAAVSGTSTLTKSQVQAIVDAAQAKNLSLAQVTKAIADATKDFPTTEDVKKINEANAKIVAAIETLDKKASTLTAKQVEEIMKSVVWQGGGVTTWFDAATYDSAKEYTLTTPEQVAGLSTLVNGGYNFEGKTVTLAPAENTTITLNAKDAATKNNWTPIGNTRGNEFKGTISGGEKGVVIEGLTLNEQFNAVKEGYLIDCASTGKMDKVGVGFVAYLGEGSTLENITFKNVDVKITNSVLDGLNVGIAVGYLDGGTIKNVQVESGSIQSTFYTAGLVGAASHGTISNCKIGTASAPVSIATYGIGNKTAEGKIDDATRCVAAGLIATLRDFADSKATGNITVENVTAHVTLKATCADGTTPGHTGKFAGKMYNNIVTVNGESVSAVQWNKTTNTWEPKDTGMVKSDFVPTTGYTVTVNN